MNNVKQSDVDDLVHFWHHAQDSCLPLDDEARAVLEALAVTKALREIADSDPVDNALDPGRNVRIAREALS